MSVKSMTITMVIISFISSFGLWAQESVEKVSEVKQEKLCIPVMVGLGTVTLKDSTKVEEFEEFIEKEYHPFTANNFPGMRWVILKCDRGQTKDDYLLMGIFDSEETRTRYYPTEGGGLSEEKQKVWEDLGGQTIRTKLLKYANTSWMGDYRLVE